MSRPTIIAVASKNDGVEAHLSDGRTLFACNGILAGRTLSQGDEWPVDLDIEDPPEIAS